ncbi:DUF3783 domain-containing protein [Selenomonas sp.]|jgi:hypothetical protein|uniref:DUF3783 domain-containing protein n=1 Tax=Selenomonas sp. TaxID=2053611 RepID=UPI001CAE158E|nr:DUF3783 domain-containing protein [Selenomonas sp.]MBF1691188.1 DUF3783 domain-containing protein [Selenomonas sp.]MBF1693248.1 DUF3783 domain-containing protein [Selenomonas sp.]MBF1706101.1 DUF3783 domain-containing protein [Selenomonas sp.]
MANSKERVLLYQFPADQAALITGALRPMGVDVQILSPDAWCEKVGYLLGRKGFLKHAAQEGGAFSFPHRVMLLDAVKGKRLTQVLRAVEDAGVPHITYKSSITPYNTLWTLRYLCEHMAKEHGGGVPTEGNTE